MMPTTDVSKMWQEFCAERAATLAELPPELSPAEAVKLGSDREGDAQIGTAGAVTTAPAGLNSWTKGYGTIVLDLLAANLAVSVCVVPLGLTVAMCVRGKGSGNTRNYNSKALRRNLLFDQDNSKER